MCKKMVIEMDISFFLPRTNVVKTSDLIHFLWINIRVVAKAVLHHYISVCIDKLVCMNI